MSVKKWALTETLLKATTAAKHTKKYLNFGSIDIKIKHTINIVDECPEGNEW